MNKCKYRLLIGGLLLLSSFSAAAHETDVEFPWYGGFALGFASADQDCDYYGYNCDGDDTSFKVYAGKRVHENLGFEVSFQDLGKIRDKGTTQDTIAESSGVNFSLLGIIPVGEFGFFYGKFGYMLWEADYTRTGTSTTTSDEDDGDVTYGAGFAFMFGEKYDFRIEYERLNELGDDFVPGGEPITVLSLGGTIYFE